MKPGLKSYIIHHENGGYVHVYATDQDDAIEQYYQTIESITGCKNEDCDKHSRPLPRNRIARPIKVQLLDDFKKENPGAWQA